MKKNFLRKNYNKSWKTLGDARLFIYGIIVVFFVSALIGYVFPVFFVDEIAQIIQEMVAEFEGVGILGAIAKIFLNNIMAGFLAFVFGIFLGIFPVISAVTNGYLVGFVSSSVVEQNGISVLWRLLPHGIFELPAIFVSMGLGVWLGMGFFQNNKKLKQKILDGLRVFFMVVLPLLIIAAIIEGLLIGLGV
jgi:stage II sporulation protein M